MQSRCSTRGHLAAITSSTGPAGRSRAVANPATRGGIGTRIQTSIKASTCVRSVHNARQVEAISPDTGIQVLREPHRVPSGYTIPASRPTPIVHSTLDHHRLAHRRVGVPQGGALLVEDGEAAAHRIDGCPHRCTSFRAGPYRAVDSDRIEHCRANTPRLWKTEPVTLEDASYIAAIVGAAIALIGFPLLGWQLFLARSQRRDAIRLSTSQVLLAAGSVLANHAEVAAKLRPGGAWHKSSEHPTEDELWEVEPYLGVFERIFIAYQAGQADAETLDQLYGYRLANIWSNTRVTEVKLQDELRRVQWARLIALTYVLEELRGCRFKGHTDSYFPARFFERRQARKISKQLLSEHFAQQSATRHHHPDLD
jgi:hypothetical protein